MSRYTIPDDVLRYEVVVGYDGPLETFFAEVWDREQPPSDGDEPVLFCGYTLGALPTVEALQDALSGYARISPEIVAALQADQDAALPLTPLQQRVRAWFHDAEKRRQ